jgi:hypothetical protein
MLWFGGMSRQHFYMLNDTRLLKIARHAQRACQRRFFESAWAAKADWLSILGFPLSLSIQELFQRPIGFKNEPGVFRAWLAMFNLNV